MTAPSRERTVEGPDWRRGAQGVDAPALLPELPPEVPFGFLGRLLPTSLDGELRLELHRLPAERALEILARSEAVSGAELAAGDDVASRHPAQLEREVDSSREVAGRVASRSQDLWRVGLALIGRGRTPARAVRLRAELVRRFRSVGFRPRIPTFEAAAAVAAPTFLGSEHRPSGYWHTLPTDGVGAFFPFVEESVLEPSGVLVGLLLEDAGPVVLDRWSHGSHSWGVFGSTGSGKTFFAALTALRSRWMRPELEVIVLDPLGEFAGLARALGGSVVGVAAGRGGRFNPLDPVTTGGDLAEKAGRAGSVLRALFPSLTDEEVGALDTTLRRLYEEGPHVPTLSDLIDRLSDDRPGVERLRSLLEVFRTGSLAYLDGPTTAGFETEVTVLDLTGVPEGHLPFHLAYLLDAVLGRCRARPGPKLVVLDEAYLMTRDPGTAAYLDSLTRHLRHYEAGLLLLSQNPDDFLGNEAGRSVLRNLRATFLLRLAEVSPETREFFGLTEVEAGWLPRARLPREAGYSEALLRFGPAHLPIALVASTPEYEFLTRGLGADRRGEAPEGPVPPHRPDAATAGGTSGLSEAPQTDPRGGRRDPRRAGPPP